MREERRKRVRDGATPTLAELRAVFHRLWGSAHDSPDYKKADWVEFRKLVFRMYRIEL